MPTVQLVIKNFAFAPASLHVGVGTAVVVTNQDSTTHTWTADDGGWDSGRLAPGASFRRSFTVSGHFGYHCSIHPSMTGSVDVG